MLVKKVIARIKNTYFPSEQQLNVRKWYADGGDYALRFNYPLDENSLVLDLGGYQGQWASDLFARYQCTVLIFEPVNAFAERIRARFINNEKLKVFAFGLGGNSRSETIHISAEGSSVFGNSNDLDDIKIIDVKEWLEHNLGNRKKINLMKVNIEGGEYELLDRLIETGLIDDIESIQVQFHEISSDSRLQMAGIQEKLLKTHEPTYQYEFVWENWQRKNNK